MQPSWSLRKMLNSICSDTRERSLPVALCVAVGHPLNLAVWPVFHQLPPYPAHVFHWFGSRDGVDDSAKGRAV